MLEYDINYAKKIIGDYKIISKEEYQKIKSNISLGIFYKDEMDKIDEMVKNIKDYTTSQISSYIMYIVSGFNKEWYIQRIGDVYIVKRSYYIKGGGYLVGGYKFFIISDIDNLIKVVKKFSDDDYIE